MSVNGVTNTANSADLYGTYNTGAKTAEKNEAVKDGTTNGVVYEPSNSADASSTKKVYKQDTALIAKMKADSDARAAQMKSLVEQMISKQGQTLGNADSIWSFLAKGDFTVDPAVKAQAQADIAEDGYWGVSQTADRIASFATALTGGNPDKIELMRDAFKEGFENATKTWGGKLPDISQKTYDAVMAKFDKMAEEAGKTITDEEGITVK